MDAVAQMILAATIPTAFASIVQAMAPIIASTVENAHRVREATREYKRRAVTSGDESIDATADAALRVLLWFKGTEDTGGFTTAVTEFRMSLPGAARALTDQPIYGTALRVGELITKLERDVVLAADVADAYPDAPPELGDMNPSADSARAEAETGTCLPELRREIGKLHDLVRRHRLDRLEHGGVPVDTRWYLRGWRALQAQVHATVTNWKGRRVAEEYRRSSELPVSQSH